MVRHVTCRGCGESFRASSIFADRPGPSICPFCGAELRGEHEGPLQGDVDTRRLEAPLDGNRSVPLQETPFHRAA